MPLPKYDPELFVQPPTFDRLAAQERVTFQTVDGATIAVFSDNDPLYPGRPVKTSTQVMFDSVHRRHWLEDEEQYIFEYFGEV
jgi:hypothetical protein